MKRSNLSILFVAYLLIGLWTQPLTAQSDWRWEGGLSFTLGQPTNQIGFSFRISHYIGQVGLNAEVGSWYRLSGLGAPGHRWESRVGLGPSIGFNALGNGEIDTSIFNTKYETEIGFIFLRYQEKFTAQNSGRLFANFGDFSLGMENDALAGGGKDRFRTGTLELAYARGNDRIALEMALWTGDTHCAAARRVEERKARNGLKLIDNCRFGKISHGLLRFKYSISLYPHQQVSFNLGIDDEHIRHFFQNKLMHDIILSVNKKVKNPHLPMLDESGMPVVDREAQRVRAAKLVWGFELNRWSVY